MQKQYPLLRKVLPLIHLVHYIQKNGLLTSISDSMYLAFESEKKCALSSHVNAADICIAILSLERNPVIKYP